MSEILVATTSAAVMVDDIPHVIEAGRTLARDSHPIVTANPGLWEPLKVQYDVDESKPEPKKAASDKASAGS